MDTNNQSDNKDFAWAVGLNRFTMRLIGIWPDKDNKSLQVVLHVLVQVLIMLFGIVIPQVCALRLVIDDLSLVVDNLTSNVAVMASSLKLLLLWHDMEKLADIVAVVTTDWRKQRLDWERNIMVKVAKRGRILTISGYILMIFSFLGILVSPIFGFKIRAINNITDHGNRYLPLQSVYPYEVVKSPYFEFSFLAQVTSAYIACICFTSPVALFGTLIYHVCGQLEILGARMKNIQFSKTKRDMEVWNKLDREFQRKVVSVVDTHVHIIRTVDMIEKFFKMLILVQVSALSIFMCCFGFQIVNAIDSKGYMTISQGMVTAGSFTNVMMHSFAYCFTGEALVEYSDNIYHCIAENNWYTFPGRKARDFLLIIQRSTKPLRMTAGKLMFLNLETFCNIFKTIIGYISMLVAIRDRSVLN